MTGDKPVHGDRHDHRGPSILAVGVLSGEGLVDPKATAAAAAEGAAEAAEVSAAGSEAAAAAVEAAPFFRQMHLRGGQHPACTCDQRWGRCYACGQAGHMRATCPLSTSEAPFSTSAPFSPQ